MMQRAGELEDVAPASTWRARLARSIVVWLAIAIVVWLDRHAVAGVHRAEAFGWFVSALEWIWRAYNVVSDFIEANLIAIVGWLWDGLKWLTSHVADFVTSAGGMFSRVWESAKLFYENVLKPALVWLHDFYTKVRDWLAKVFKPVFEFLRDVRELAKDIYKRFISPLLTVIDVTRAALRVLGDLGVEWAKKLDATLGEWEGIITRNFALFMGKLNQVIDLLESVVTPDRLFQRLPIVRTLDRDAGFWIRLWWNKQIVNRPAGSGAFEKVHRRRPAEDAAALGQYWEDGTGPLAPAITLLQSQLLIALGAGNDAGDAGAGELA